MDGSISTVDPSRFTIAPPAGFNTLPIPDHAQRIIRNGVEITLLPGHDGQPFAIFERTGHTCILSGHVINESTLIDLASWHANGAIQF